MIVRCPWCTEFIEILELNCGVFRHGVFKNNGRQLNAHASKEECESVVGEIYGCGKPFQVVDGKAIKCDYI
jgi:hypothetical protein